MQSQTEENRITVVNPATQIEYDVTDSVCFAQSGILFW
jgi:hypothetical protein